jgi:DNA-binding CsgD family transcriptional regulator
MPTHALTARRSGNYNSDVILDGFDRASLAQLLDELLSCGSAVSVVFIRRDPVMSQRESAAPRLRPGMWTRLTPRQRSVAGLVALALTNRQIASRLRISEHTVNYHLRQIFITLDIASRVELAQFVRADHPIDVGS